MKPKANKISPMDVFIGERIREERLKSGLSQEKLGELVGLTFQQIHKYEIGLNRISASKLYEISQTMEKPMKIFFDEFEDDELFFNFKPANENEHLKKSSEDMKQINALIKSFNQIRSEEVKRDLINLVKSLGSIRSLSKL
jgi:transcriptional regulator with XRE-family HTH domain